FFFSSRRRHTRFSRDWSSDVCSSDLVKFWFWLVFLPFDHSTSSWLRVTGLLCFVASLHLGSSSTLPPVPFLRWAVITRRLHHLRSEERRVGKECRSRWTECQYRRTRR